MGREVRRVAPDWQHPRCHDGRWRPLFGQDYQSAAEQWLKEFQEFIASDEERSKALEWGCHYFWDWHGPPPDREYYMYEIPPDPTTLTHFQLYETTSEGTPIGPVFATMDELCEWAAENATTFASFKASAEEWRRMLDDGFVTSPEVELGNGVKATCM